MIDSILIKLFLFTRNRDSLLVQKYRISVTLRVNPPASFVVPANEKKTKPKMVGWRQGRWRVLARSCVCEVVLRLCVKARFICRFTFNICCGLFTLRYTLHCVPVQVRDCFSCLANVPSVSLLLFCVRW